MLYKSASTMTQVVKDTLVPVTWYLIDPPSALVS
jgi:hypothetical protein